MNEKAFAGGEEDDEDAEDPTNEEPSFRAFSGVDEPSCDRQLTVLLISLAARLLVKGMRLLMKS